MIDFVDEVRKLRRDLGIFTRSDACLIQAQGAPLIYSSEGVQRVLCRALIGSSQLKSGGEGNTSKQVSAAETDSDSFKGDLHH